MPHPAHDVPEEHDVWMQAPCEEANALQRPLPEGALQTLATGLKEDQPLAGSLCTGAQHSEKPKPPAFGIPALVWQSEPE